LDAGFIEGRLDRYGPQLEPGMDIFMRQDDGTWKIIRYLAYTSPE
jgi:hypothetical protein